MRTTSFEIPGEPGAHEWDKLIADAARRVASNEELSRLEPYAGPVELGCLFYCRPPENWTDADRRAALAGERDHIHEPCLSVLLKGIETSLAGILYRARSQICAYSDVDGIPTGKYYALDAASTTVIVVVRYTDEA
jgi:hypothetical protein